jgi:hypothetical protein
VLSTRPTHRVRIEGSGEAGNFRDGSAVAKSCQRIDIPCVGASREDFDDTPRRLTSGV